MRGTPTGTRRLRSVALDPLRCVHSPGAATPQAQRWALALEEWHLAPAQSAQCDYGVNPVDRTTCKRGTEFLSVSYRNRNPDRDIQTINDGTAHDDVPDGCSSKTTRGDWAAHLKRTPANYDGNGLFQLVCWQRPPLTATCFVGVDDDTPLFTEPPSPDSPPQPPLLPLPPLPPLPPPPPPSHCGYQVIPELVSQAEAFERCTKAGTEVAMVKSASQNAELFHAMQQVALQGGAGGSTLLGGTVREHTATARPHSLPHLQEESAE